MANHRNKFSLYNIGLLFKGSFVKKAVDLYATYPPINCVFERPKTVCSDMLKAMNKINPNLYNELLQEAKCL
jgi:hypothetical protein